MTSALVHNIRRTEQIAHARRILREMVEPEEAATWTNYDISVWANAQGLDGYATAVVVRDFVAEMKR